MTVSSNAATGRLELSLRGLARGDASRLAQIRGLVAG